MQSEDQRMGLDLPLGGWLPPPPPANFFYTREIEIERAKVTRWLNYRWTCSSFPVEKSFSLLLPPFLFLLPPVSARFPLCCSGFSNDVSLFFALSTLPFALSFAMLLYYPLRAISIFETSTRVIDRSLQPGWMKIRKFRVENVLSTKPIWIWDAAANGRFFFIFGKVEIGKLLKISIRRSSLVTLFFAAL